MTGFYTREALAFNGLSTKKIPGKFHENLKIARNDVVELRQTSIWKLLHSKLRTWLFRFCVLYFTQIQIFTKCFFMAVVSIFIVNKLQNLKKIENCLLRKIVKETIEWSIMHEMQQMPWKLEHFLILCGSLMSKDAIHN